MQIEKNPLKYWYSWVGKKHHRGSIQATIQPLTNIIYTDHGPMGLGQYNSLGEYCGLNTASSVSYIINIT